MGFFSGSKHVSVSSSVYNLAGDEATRPNYLKTAVVGAVMASNDQTIGENITSSYINGPGIHLRHFGNWCADFGYSDFIGMAGSSLSLPGSIDASVVTGQIPHDPGYTVVVLSAVIGKANVTYWADQWVMAHDPINVNSDYTSDINPVTKVVTITYTDLSTHTFTASDYDPANYFLFVQYTLKDSGGIVSPPLGFIYGYGTGNATLDAQFVPSTTSGSFLPYIPVRINNNFISTTNMPDVYTQAKKAYKKATRAKFDDLVTKISANSSLADIDYAYVVFGVSLNVKENACRRYIYEFFSEIMQGQDLTGSGFASFLTQWNAAHTAMQAWLAWSQDNYQNTSGATTDGRGGGALSGTPQPPMPTYPPIPNYVVEISSSNKSILNFDMRINWAGISETFGTGLAKPGAKPGDVWFDTGVTTTLTQSTYIGTPLGGTAQATSSAIALPHVRLTHQIDANTWSYLDLYGLNHANMIYQGNGVGIPAPDALADANESGFIIPLHTGVLRNMPLVLSTQMATADCFVVFNAYKVVTSPWYTSNFFKIIIVVAVIVITVATAGAGDIGLLGANAAVGAALGATGVTATILGATVNALAAIVLVQVIQIGATAIFGSKLGAIIGAIVAILALDVGSVLANGGSLSTAFDSLMRVDNLIKITDALGKGVSGYIMGKAQDVLNETQTLNKEYSADSKEISAKYEEMIGYDHGLIDPLSLVDVKPPSVVVPSEMPQDFLSRTLLAGSDIADLSMSMISNFSDIMLNRDLVLT